MYNKQAVSDGRTVSIVPPTQAVPDLSRRYPTRWAICCASKLGYSEGNVRTNQQDSKTFVCQIRMASQTRI